jgi:hypothetical protein
MATLSDFQIRVSVIDGPNREELFDSNRLVELNLMREFTFMVSDRSGKLQFVDFLGHPSPINGAKITVPAEIISCESRNSVGTMWLVKLVMPFKMTAIAPHTTRFYTEMVEVRIIYSTSNRHGDPIDRKFVQKCMRYYDRSDENNPNGLWFTTYIAQPIEAA